MNIHEATLLAMKRYLVTSIKAHEKALNGPNASIYKLPAFVARYETNKAALKALETFYCTAQNIAKVTTHSTDKIV